MQGAAREVAAKSGVRRGMRVSDPACAAGVRSRADPRLRSRTSHRAARLGFARLAATSEVDYHEPVTGFRRRVENHEDGAARSTGNAHDRGGARCADRLAPDSPERHRSQESGTVRIGPSPRHLPRAAPPGSGYTPLGRRQRLGARRGSPVSHVPYPRWQGIAIRPQGSGSTRPGDAIADALAATRPREVHQPRLRSLIWRRSCVIRLRSPR